MSAALRYQRLVGQSFRRRINDLDSIAANTANEGIVTSHGSNYWPGKFCCHDGPNYQIAQSFSSKASHSFGQIKQGSVIRNEASVSSSEIHASRRKQNPNSSGARNGTGTRNRNRNGPPNGNGKRNARRKRVESISFDVMEKYDRGSMPPAVVKEAIECVKYWATCRSQRDIDRGGRILLRLRHEMVSPTEYQLLQQSHSQSPERISKDWVTLVASFMMKIKQRKNVDEFSSFALDILKELESVNYDHTDHEVKKMIPRIYNMTMDSLSKNEQRNSIAHIEHLLEVMNSSSIEPDASSYNSLLYAHSVQRERGSAKRCEAVLRQLQRNPRTKTIIDTISYNIVINAWGKSDDRHSANRAEMILREMQEKYANDGQLRIKPSLISFTSVINAWSRFSEKDVEAAQGAEGIFRLLDEFKEFDEDLRPNAFTFHALMNAYSMSSLPGAASKTEDLLEEMMVRYKGGDEGARPNRISFSICIKTWARSEEKGKSQKVRALLEQMQALSKDGHDTSPDIGIFNSVLRTFANDSDEMKASKAEQIIADIKTSNLHPDLVSYNNVLRCCCTTRSDDAKVRRNAIRIATETLLNIQKRKIIPDPYTFNFFIKACDRLTSGQEKLKLIKVAFLYCTDSCVFSPPVLSLLKNALNPQELKHMLQIKDDVNLQSLKVTDFPAEWSSQSRRVGNAKKSSKLII